MNEPQMGSAQQQKTARVVKWALVIGIVVILNLFFNYALSLVYKEPAFDRFCPIALTSKTYTDKIMCTEVGGEWTETTSPVAPDKSNVSNPVQVSGYCNATFTCNQAYDTQMDSYNRNVFIILVILGVLSLVLGAFLTNLSSVVALGFSFGGVLSLIIGAMRYWSDMQDVLRVVVLAVALGALIWVGIKKIKE